MPPYQTASGYTTTVGPCSHWSRQPARLARTEVFIPRIANSLLNANCRLPSPSGSQLPRGFSGGRWFVQMKICRSNFAISRNRTISQDNLPETALLWGETLFTQAVVLNPASLPQSFRPVKKLLFGTPTPRSAFPKMPPIQEISTLRQLRAKVRPRGKINEK